MLPDKINVIKSIEIMRTHYIGAALLETGVVIHLRSDGSALGEDGKTYYTVSKNDINGDCEILGYSSDIEGPIDDIRELSTKLFRI